MKPKRRKYLRFQNLKELGLNPEKIQVLFILNSHNYDLYMKLISSFDNNDVQISIYNTSFDIVKCSKFRYFKKDLDIHLELSDYVLNNFDNSFLRLGLLSINTVDELNSLKIQTHQSSKNEICIILAHCDTEEKKETLIECIQILKNTGQKIILSSHIDMETSIKESVDYFIYDKKNEMIRADEEEGRGRTYAYASYGNYHHELNYDNHALAVLTLMKNGLGLAFANGYEVSHLIHYDCIIYDSSVLYENNKNLSDCDIVHYFYEGFSDRLDGNFLSVRTDTFLNAFKNINTKKDYCDHEFAIFECFLRKVSLESGLKTKSYPIEDLFYKNIIDKHKLTIFQVVKEYDCLWIDDKGNIKSTDEVYTNTYVYLSYEKSTNNKYLLVTSNDANVTEVVINGQPYQLVFNDINLFLVDDKLISNKINVYFPYLEIEKIIDENTLVADCSYCDTSNMNFHIINGISETTESLKDKFYSLDDYKKTHNQEILPIFVKVKNEEKIAFLDDLFETMIGEDFSRVSKRCLTHDGVIVDLGCLNWDWSSFFIGKKKVIGVDPQEFYEPTGAVLFKGAVSDYTGFGKMIGSGESASVIRTDSGFPVLNWKDFLKRYDIDKISILKINIEGGEYDLINSLDAEDFDKIDQIAVSFHIFDGPNLSTETLKCMKLFQDNNYKILDLADCGWFLCVKN